MSLSFNIDHNWSCCHRASTDNDNIVTLVDTSTVDDSDWSPVKLPHVAAIDEENVIHNHLEKWWYRKQFQLTLLDQSPKESIFLTFKSSDNGTEDTDDSITSCLSAVVWLNAIKIFSGLLRTPQTSIELPQILLNSNQIENDDHKHTLIVCCLNMRLSFNAFLTVPSDAISSDKEVPFNTTTENIGNLSPKYDGVYDYVTSGNGIDAMLEKTISEEKIQENKHLDGVNHTSIPRLSIVMLVVGTRGDVQPLIAYGKALRAVGHRVRFATHEKFRKFVRDNGLEFFPLGGDPTEIMSFMVQNSGIIPSINTIIKGNLFQRRRIFTSILNSTWLACISDDDETAAPFRAEAIIANPISYGHIHCAQKLGIPLHMVFTMPSSPTTAFPHPLSNIDYSKTPRERLNIFSYSLIDTVVSVF